MWCEKCSTENWGRVCGQAITEWTCPICGQKFFHPNTAVPAVCKRCSELCHVCEECGNPIIDNS